jgi:hypothetical protein
VTAEAEEFPLLEAVTTERLVKTQKTIKDLACAIEICKMWRSAMAQYISVFSSIVLKWPLNPISNPNPVDIHSLNVTLLLKFRILERMNAAIARQQRGKQVFVVMNSIQ